MVSGFVISGSIWGKKLAGHGDWAVAKFIVGAKQCQGISCPFFIRRYSDLQLDIQIPALRLGSNFWNKAPAMLLFRLM